MDLRVDLILRVQNDHSASAFGTSKSPKGEHWRCACGESYQGKGALSSGHRHSATEILSALDAAATNA